MIEDIEIKFNNDDFEIVLIDYLVKDFNYLLKTAKYLEANYFDNETNKLLYIIIKNYIKKYNVKPDWTTLKIKIKQIKNIDDEIKDNLLERIDFYNDETLNYNKEFIQDECQKFIEKNRIIKAIQESINDIDYPEKYNQIVERIKEARQIDLNFDYGISIKAVDERIQRYKELDDIATIPTGFPKLDDSLNGGFKAKRIYSVSAPPGIGKSIWLANFAMKAFQQGHKAAFITLENSLEETYARLDAIFTQIPQIGIYDSKEKQKTIKQKYNELKQFYPNAELLVKELPSYTIDVYDIEFWLNELFQYNGTKIDLLAVDYAALMNSTDSNLKLSEMYVRVRRIFEDLKNLAKRLEIPIITASQLNRSSLDPNGGTKPITSGASISDSLGILQTLDFHGTINQSNRDKNKNQMQLYVDKSRFGKDKFTIPYEINYPTLTLTEL